MRGSIPTRKNPLVRFRGAKRHMIDALRKVGGVKKATAERILEAYPDGQGLSQASVESLMHLGATERQAERLHAAFALARYCDAACMERLRRMPLVDPTNAAAAIRSIIGPKEAEHFLVLLLDARQRIIEAKIIAIGSVARVDIHPRELFRDAVRLGAHSVVLSHNHPSGSSEPSDADIELTNRISEVGRLVGIPVIDHLVVTPTEHTSLAALGFISR